MLAVNSTISPAEGSDLGHCLIGEPMVVMWLSSGTDRIFLTAQFGKPRRPRCLPLSHLTTLIEDRVLLPGTLQTPEHLSRADIHLPPRSREIRDRRHAIIEPLLEDVEELLLPTYGSKLVEARALEQRVARSHVYELLYQYFQLGQILNALLPLYGSRKSRRTTQCAKIGRPRKYSNYRGKNVSETDIDRIRDVLKRHYVLPQSKRPCTLVKAYEKFCENFHAKEVSYDSPGLKDVTLDDLDTRITWDQFYYHARKLLDVDFPNWKRTRIGKKEFDKDFAGRTGDAPQSEGFGDVYQLDATVHDLELTSPLDLTRQLRIGRVTLYLVVDVFSDMIVGFHVTIDPPSYEGARMALFQAFRNKIDLCRDFGITIDEDDWFCRGAPSRLLVDNQEFQTRLQEHGDRPGRFAVVMCRTKRGDDKGLIENAIHRHTQSASQLPGFVQKNIGHSERRDPKLEALLTPRELAQALIREILVHNNKKDKSRDYLDVEMVKAGVKPVPRDIARWSMQYRPTSRRLLAEHEIYLRLLPRAEVALKKEGIDFRGLHYRCPWALQKGLQNRNPKRHTSPRYEVLYYAHCVDLILLVTEDGLQPATLTDKSRRFRGLSWFEVEAQTTREKHDDEGLKEEALAGRIGLAMAQSEVVATARAEQEKVSRAELSKQSIREQREEAAQVERDRESRRFLEMAGCATGSPGESEGAESAGNGVSDSAKGAPQGESGAQPEGVAPGSGDEHVNALRNLRKQKGRGI